MKLLDKYVSDVLSGEIVTGKLVRLACERHMDDLKDDRFIWREDMAQKAVKHFFSLKHYKGKWAGQPFTLEGWQVFIIGSIFGWYRQDGTRRYREAYVEVGRKNGKTILAAGVGTYLFLKDGEPGAEVYCVATKEEQSKRVWNDSKFMIEAAPHLNQITRTFHNTMSADGGKSTFKPLGKNSKTHDGLNPHGAIGDELHEWPDRRMYDVIASAFGARLQPLFMNITTAGLSRDCFCFDHRQHCINVLMGRKAGYDDESLFMYIASLDKDDDPFNEVNWIKANPNLGVSVSIDTMRDRAKRAKLHPSGKNNFLTKELNMWVDNSSTWFDMSRWDLCKEDINWDDWKGQQCFGGVDLATSTDFAAMCLLFPDGKEYVIKPHLWIPEETLNNLTKLRDRRVLDRICKWRDEGYVTDTPGDFIDYDIIEEQIKEYAKTYRIVDIGFDPYNAGNLPQRLIKEGIECTLITQGHRTLGGPTKDFEGLVLSGDIRHDGNPVMRWMLGNVILIEDTYGNMRPDKKKSHEKIDGVIAALMALQRAQHVEAKPVPGVHVL